MKVSLTVFDSAIQFREGWHRSILKRRFIEDGDNLFNIDVGIGLSDEFYRRLPEFLEGISYTDWSADWRYYKEHNCATLDLYVIRDE